MPGYAQKKRRTTKRRTTKKRATQKRVTHRRRTYRQGDVFNTGGPEIADYRTGTTIHTGPSGYGITGALASMFQGRNQVGSYGLRPVAPVVLSSAGAVPEESVAAASTSGDAVVQQRAVRRAMQRIIRAL